jgi:prolyl-tRNA editing enzyme YbaK/EbsC (Cys-tRNA(Pro) deacylase)
MTSEALLREEEVWAAGHTHAVFKLDPTELLEMTGSLVVAVK